MNTPDKKSNYNSMNIIKFAWRKRYILIIVSAIAFVTSAILSLTIPDKYKSTVSMFPTASVSISNNLVEITSGISSTVDLLSFGDESEVERLIQILNSHQVMAHIIDKFNLYDHYSIDSTNADSRTKIIAKYKSNIEAKRTMYTSIILEVRDQNPEIAAAIANEVATYADKVYRNIRKERAFEAMKIARDEYNATNMLIEKISDSLRTIREKGVHDYETQAEAYNRAYGEALIENNQHAIKTLSAKFDTLAKYGGIYVELSERLLKEIQRNNILKTRYSATKVNYENNVSNIYILDKAVVADTKDSPSRSIIVFISTLSTFAFTLLLLVIKESLKEQS